MAHVVTELRLGDVQRQILLANFVEGSNDTALEDRPESFDGVGMNCADNVLTSRVIDDLVVGMGFIEEAIPASIVADQQAIVVGDHFTDKLVHGIDVGPLNDTGNHAAIAFNSADHTDLTGPGASALAVTLALVSIFGLSAYPSLIHFDDALKDVHFILHGDADTMAHVPSGAVVYGQFPFQLFTADSLIRRAHEPDSDKPLGQGNVRIVEDGAHGDAVLILAVQAEVQVAQFSGLAGGLDVTDAFAFTLQASETVRPAYCFQVRDAFLLGVELLSEFSNGNLLAHVGSEGVIYLA